VIFGDVSGVDITRRKSRDAEDPLQSQARTSEECDYPVIFDLLRIEVLAPTREYHVPRFLNSSVDKAGASERDNVVIRKRIETEMRGKFSSDSDAT